MELGLIFKALLALIFVLGLLFLTLWAVKSCQLRGAKSLLMRKLQNDKRLRIIENQRIDIRNSIVLVSKDDKEYLLLLGTSQNLILESTNIPPAQEAAHD